MRLLLVAGDDAGGHDSSTTGFGALEYFLSGDLDRAVSRDFLLAILWSPEPSGLSGTRCVSHDDTFLCFPAGAEHLLLFRPGNRRRARVQRRQRFGELFERRAAARRIRYADQHIRVSDADRSAVAEQLGAHYADGRLDQAEFDERTGGGLGGTDWVAPLLPRDFAPPVDLRWPEYVTTVRGEEWWLPTPNPAARQRL